MKKDIKKIDKKKLKEHIKKYSLLALNITCYICTAIFVISLIVGACSTTKQSAKVEKPVSTMILRDKPIYRANGNLLNTYYTDINSIELSNNQFFNLVGSYDDKYIYKNPTFLDVNNVFASILSVGDYAYFSTTNPIEVGYGSSLLGTTLTMYRSSNDIYILGVMVSNGNISNFAYWRSSDYYITINQPVRFNYIFNNNVSWGGGDISQMSDLNKTFRRFIAYYYSSNSFRNMSINFFDNPSYSLTLSFAEYYINNNYFFYSTPLWEYILANDNNLLDYVFEIPIAEGGFSVNGQYYTDLVCVIRSAYSTLSNGGRVNYYGFTPNTALADYSNSTNESYKGYFFIESISLTNRDNPVGNLGFSLYSVPRGLNAIPSLNGYFYTFFQSDFVSPSYKYINCYFLSHRVLSDGYSVNILSHNSFVNLSLVANYFPTATPIVQDTGNPFVFTRVFEWINLSFVGLLPILQFSVLPGITIGAILLVPFIITLLLFIVKLFKR